MRVGTTLLLSIILPFLFDQVWESENVLSVSNVGKTKFKNVPLYALFLVFKLFSWTKLGLFFFSLISQFKLNFIEYL